MGDRKRSEVLAEFIRKNFPSAKYNKVLDVAGGQGNLALLLTKLGYSVIVVDPRRTNLSKKERKEQRQKRLHFDRVRQKFTKEYEGIFDLIVGLHPDEATLPIMEWAALNKIAYVVVPCCIKHDNMELLNKLFIGVPPKHTMIRWFTILQEITKKTHRQRIGYLNIKGAKTMLFGYPKER